MFKGREVNGGRELHRSAMVVWDDAVQSEIEGRYLYKFVGSLSEPILDPEFGGGVLHGIGDHFGDQCPDVRKRRVFVRTSGASIG